MYCIIEKGPQSVSIIERLFLLCPLSEKVLL